MGFGLKSGNGTTFKKMGCKPPFLSRTQPSPFYKDDKERPEKEEKEEVEKEEVEKDEPVKEEPVKEDKPVIEAPAESKPLPTGVAAPEEFNFEQALEDKKTEVTKEPEATKEDNVNNSDANLDQKFNNDISRDKTAASDTAKHMARSKLIETPVQNKLLTQAPKVINAVVNKIPTKNAGIATARELAKSRAKKALAKKMAVKVALKFVPGVGQISMAYDAAKLLRYGIKNRKQIASWMKNKTKSIKNSIDEFGDPPKQVT